MSHYFLNGFYDDRVHVIPEGAIPLSDEAYQLLCDAERAGKRIVRQGEDVVAVEPDPVPADYDAAMENYLRQTRAARGYTLREPSDYVNSSVPRWARDAADWIAFRDAVLLYGLNLQNTVAAGGGVPMEAFLAGMPVIAWSFHEQ